MKSMTVGSFLGYSAAGLVCALIAWGAQSCASRDDRLHPDYKSYRSKHSAYEKAKRGAEVGVDQRHFEEALAGVYPVERLPNADLQEVARAIQSVAKRWHSTITDKDADDRDRSASAELIAHHIYWNPNGPHLKDRTWQEKRLLSCDLDGCRFEREVSVLGDPSRLVLLLNGDAAGVLSSLPTEIGDIGVEPTYPKDGPRSVELPWSYSFRVWVVCSIIFVLGFMGTGAFYSYDVPGNCLIGSHPLAAPNFVFGWIVMAFFAPGFLLAHGLKAAMRDARPYVERVRARFFPRAFDDEFGELTARLKTMRAREQAAGNAAVLGDIDALIEKIGTSKSRRHVAELRKALDDIDGYLNARETLDRELGDLPAD